MSIRTRSRRTSIITAYVMMVVILFLGRQLATHMLAPANEPVENALIFISDADSIDAGRDSNSVYRTGLDGRGLKRIVGSIPHGDSYLRTTDIDCDRASQQLVIASHRRDLNGFHHALLDGSGLHLDQPGAGDVLSATRQIAIAPDGKSIIVSRQFEGFEEARFGLVAGDLVSREFKTIKAPTADRSYDSPVYSPGGHSVAYIIERQTRDLAKTYQLAIANPAGAYERVIFETSARISDLDWSPDGEWLAVVVNQQIYRMRHSGGEPIRLTYHLGGASSPRWSPDGHWISFVAPSSFPGFQQLILMNADGRQVRQVATIHGDVRIGCWV